MELAIRTLLRTRTRAKILAGLDNRCTWRGLQHWRAGRRRPPAWVRDRLCAMLRESPVADLLEQAPVYDGPRQHGYRVGLPALRRLAARQAAEKERAAQGGPDPSNLSQERP